MPLMHHRRILRTGYSSHRYRRWPACLSHAPAEAWSVGIKALGFLDIAAGTANPFPAVSA